MATHYDVIIIGSGAGGGTLFHALAPTGKRILLLERGGYVPREKANWSTTRRQRGGQVQHERGLARRGGAPSFTPTPTTTSAATRSSTARRCSASAARTSGSSSTGAASRRLGRSPTRTWSPTTREPEQLYHVHGERGVDPTDPPASAPYPHRAVSHEPRIQQLSDDMARLGLKPFHVPLGIMLDEQNPRRAGASAARPATAIRA